MSRRIRTAVLVAVALVLSVLAPTAAAPAVVLAPTALTATSVSGWTTTAVTMKLGGELSRAVTVKPAAARTVNVQARKGLSGTVSTRATLTTNKSGQVTARFVPPSTGTWYVRLAVKANASFAGATTAWRKVTVSGTAGSATATTPTVSPSSVLVGSSQKVSTTVKPAGVRTVEIWAKAPGSSTFTRRGTVSSSSTGAASLWWKAPSAGTWTYKVYVRPSLTLKGAWTSTRTASVTQIPGQVTDLEATPSETSVVLTWTNPTQYLDRISVVRTLASAAEPTTPVGGVSVLFEGKIVSTATDTGLADGTAYRYSVFALDAKNNHRDPVSIITTTLDTPPASPTGLAVDVESAALQASLSWTNPVEDLDHVVVRRTLAAQDAPLTIDDGDAVTLASATASSVVDSGLTGGTAYRWSVFAVNANGTASAPVHITATAMDAAHTWSAVAAKVQLAGGVRSLDCGLSTWCAVGDQYGNAMTYDGTSWSAPQALPGSPGGINSISCPFDGWCVAVTTSGRAAVYTLGEWQEPVAVSGSTLRGVGCAPGSTTCIAVGQNAYYVTTDGADWSAYAISASLRDVDCASSLYCALVAAGGRTFSLANLTTLTEDAAVSGAGDVTQVDCIPSTTTCFYAGTGGKAWKTGDAAAVDIDAGREITGISCSSTTACFAVDYQGYIVRYASGWGVPSKALGGTQLVGVSCPDSICFAADTSASRIGRWNGAAWSLGDPIDAYTGATRVSCASSTFCMAGDQAGRISRWDGSTWTPSAPLGRRYTINALDCLSTSFCVAASSSGEVFMWDGASWSGEYDLGGALVRTLDCVSPTWCIVMTSDDRVTMWDGVAWSDPVTLGVGGDFVDVSCPTASFCLAVTFGGQWLRYADGSWDATTSSVAGPGLYSVECTSSSFCVALDTANDVRRWDPVGLAWGAAASIADTAEPYYLSCPTETSCTGVGLTPLRSYVWSGADWATGPSVTPEIAIGMLSCSGARFCMAIDALNNTYVGTR